MRITRVLAAAVFLVAAGAGAAHAQFAVEGRVGAAIPQGDDLDGAETGFGLEASAAYSVTPMVDLYAGFSWAKFGIEDEDEVDLTDSGFFGGARVKVPTGAVQTWLRGGVLLNVLKFSGEEDGVSASVESDRGVGFEIGGGVEIPVSPNIAVTPGIRYRAYSADFGAESESGDVKYIAIDVGARLTL